jgi:protein-S-isoprenylcysteine O-methyltransferase Ste14
MFAITLGFFGLVAFVLGTLISGLWLRGHPSRENAEKSSRTVHFLFFAGLGLPFVIAFFSPGLRQLDEVAGIPPLPYETLFYAAGILIALPGLYLMGASNRSLRATGSGANAFRLTRRVVDKDIYQTTRNPMSLGYYLLGFSIAFLSGSTLLTLYVLFGIIPAHLFCLKFFEELELELRFGASYRQYKRTVPFLFPKLRATTGHNTLQP